MVRGSWRPLYAYVLLVKTRAAFIKVPFRNHTVAMGPPPVSQALGSSQHSVYTVTPSLQ